MKLDLGPWEFADGRPAFEGYTLTIKLENARDGSGVLVIMRTAKGMAYYETSEKQSYADLLSKDGDNAFWQVKNRLSDRAEQSILAGAGMRVDPAP